MSNYTIEVEACSKWYGHILGISNVSWNVRPGIVGLLGPNGAGKSTLMKLLAGLLRPSRGTARILGEEPYGSRTARSRIGHCPEHDGLYDELSAAEFVTTMAELSGLGRDHARSRANEVLDQLGLSQARDRKLGGFSKGMRQRTKIAQALVHDPEVILLDEPMTGVDPIARASISELIAALGQAGKTVVLSSHVLYEIEALTEEVMLIYRGQVIAEGNVYEIRNLIDAHPHRVRVVCREPRLLGGTLARSSHVARIHFDRDAVVIETTNPDQCYQAINQFSLEENIPIDSLTSPDNNLGAVFDYLTGGRR